MPAEWEAHKATWLAWPNESQTWLKGRYSKVRDVYLQMIEALLPQEHINLLVRSRREEDLVRKFLKSKVSKLDRLRFFHVDVADIWIRDYGPTFVKKLEGNGMAWCKWKFNAWGEKYTELTKDAEVFNRASLIDAPCFVSDIVLEGGSIDVNGEGLGITTEACLLNKNRNQGWSRERIEKYLRDYLSIENLIWLKDGIAGDDTDGHVDDVTRFANVDTLFSCWEEDPHDVNYEILAKNWNLLREKRSRYTPHLKLIKLPMPGIVATSSHRFPATYANFYIANGIVLVPVYRHKHDRPALQIIAEIFDDREVIPIECLELIHGRGSLHCITQQEPA